MIGRGKVFSHMSPEYQYMLCQSGVNRYNGARYYSEEIVRNIIPNVETDRNWITVNVDGCGFDHSIVFIHNNVNPERYAWLADFDDLILVCGVPSTCGKVAHLGRAVYLPLSVDVAEVEAHRREKDRGTCYAGRIGKNKRRFPKGTDHISALPRPEFLDELARYEKVYAVGRTAIEARVLGAEEILPYDDRFPDPSVWEILDNRDAAAMLQEIVDEIDGRPGDGGFLLCKCGEELETEGVCPSCGRYVRAE